MAAEALLTVRDLKKHFQVREGWRRKRTIYAVNGVSFEVGEGETFGLVGESGCGKTTVGRLVLRLIEPTSGTIRFAGQDVLGLDKARLKAMRKDMQMVFQNPYASLNPRLTAGGNIAESLIIHGIGSAREHRERVREMLRTVGLQPDYIDRYPHEFSGGQRQRIGIARTLILRPRLIVCDEPVSALDVSVQAQILNLLQELKEQFGFTYILVAHGLHVVEHMSDRIGVMYLGRLVEVAPARQIFAAPGTPTPRRWSRPSPSPIRGRRASGSCWKATCPAPPPCPPGACSTPAAPTPRSSAGRWSRRWSTRAGAAWPAIFRCRRRPWES
jgi:ABC-type oligopeptide transport system ATPase subunit